MNFTTDCQFLENELLDVVRLFKRRPETLAHSFRFEKGVFYNAFTIDGQEFFFEDGGQVCDELEFKRFERRFAKLRLYEILSALYNIPKLPSPYSFRFPYRRNVLRDLLFQP